jgi:gamma-glutamylcyclotransferase (GGCT)/AIG2-like uncharacterized protein YtfP
MGLAVADKCLLFAYGLLKPGSPNAPKSAALRWQDRIRGELVVLDGYHGAIKVGLAETWIDGYTMEIDSDELPALDAFEDVEGGEYSRRLVETELGHLVWVYEYKGTLP